MTINELGSDYLIGIRIDEEVNVIQHNAQDLTQS